MAFLETAIPATFRKGVPGQTFLRNYGSVRPVLAANNIPVVSATTGLGTGGGAGMNRLDTNGASGLINVFLGPGFSQNLTVAIAFPSAPPTLKWTSSLGVFTVANVGSVFTLTFSSVAGIARSAPWLISFQPATAT